MQENPHFQVELPKFTTLDPNKQIDALKIEIQKNRHTIANLLKQTSFSWDNLIYPLEEMSDTLDKLWSPLRHLNSVKNTEDLRKVYNEGVALLTEYATEIGHNTQLYNAYRQIAENKSFQQLDFAQQKIIQDGLRDFKLSGVALNDTEKKHFLALQKKHSELTSKFEENLLDATHAWSKTIVDETQLAGIPQHAISEAKQEAEKRNIAGWVFTLEFPSYYAVITYAESRQLREEFYTAYVTRASDQGPYKNQWDNSVVMEEILKVRQKIAGMLGFSNYAELSLATKMAKKTETVMDFLHDLVNRSYPAAKKELQALCEFAKTHYQFADVQAWDIAFLSEKLREHEFNFSQEDLRPYFPETKVISGLLAIVSKLYGITVKPVEVTDVWDKSVQVYAIYSQENTLCGYCYFDLYARPHKHGGAWVDDFCGRFHLANGKTQLPVAYVTCNFTKPTADHPALFTHDEVITLFHEFGHALHHILTKVNYLSVSGTRGVLWDAVELPSQFMENWCWEKEALNLFANHYQTQQPIPDELYSKLIAAKNFQAAMHMIRQLEFALFDFRIHSEYNHQQPGHIQTILNDVRNQVSVVPIAPFNRFQHSFSHIFAGGYAAGYYSYKWAEVLSSDAFSKFEETGLFNQKTGHAFLKNILEMGGSKDPLELFVAFRGREPKIDALLKHNGLD